VAGDDYRIAINTGLCPVELPVGAGDGKALQLRVTALFKARATYKRLPPARLGRIGNHPHLPGPPLAAIKSPHRSQEIGNIIGVLCSEEPYPSVGS